MASPRSVRVRRTPGDLFEIRTVGKRFAPLEDTYHRIIELSWLAYFALISGSFVVANAVFACLYLLQHGSIAGARDTFSDAFFFSVQSLATIGYGTMAPGSLYGHILVTFEALTGLLGFALITGITFSKFARPTARVLFSKKVVVGERDGQRFIMFRIANERHNQIVEATLRVTVLQNVVTKEGEELRIPFELPLVRDRTTFFRLTWTASHKIDEKSPFYGPKALEQLLAKQTQIYLGLTGLDETIAQMVHARYAYSLDDIVWGARFKDTISVVEGGARQIDYTAFHETIDQPFTTEPGAEAPPPEVDPLKRDHSVADDDSESEPPSSSESDEHEQEEDQPLLS